MKCEEVRDELIAYARDELQPARKTAIEEHLVRCADCTRELEGARKVMALTQMADDASSQNLASEIIQAALARRASDIHIERCRREEPRLRFRIDGVLQLQPEPAISPELYEPLINRFKLMAEQNLSEKRLPQDGRFKIDHAGKTYDFRMSTFPYITGESLVIRILDPSNILLGLDKLGLRPAALAQIQGMISRPDGLILATGPTGAGKTTLLYSILNRLNRPEIMLMTIEDPVEYQLAGVNQGQVLRRAGLTFATALRSFMRQDPDVIMVGEIRDLETLEMAAQAALTGHLILSVLHTRDAVGALTRALEIGIEPFVLAATLTGVIGQRLVRRICPACREPYQPPEALLRGLGFTPGARPETFYHGTGCDQCGGTGYQGRIGLFEPLVMSPALAEMLGHPHDAIRARALELGLLTPFAADARAKIVDGLTTAEEIDRVLPDLEPAGAG